jgi:hypothetical protein
MKCGGCGTETPETDLIEHEGRMLCEVCCIEMLAPPKDCRHGGQQSNARTRREMNGKREERNG